MCVCVHTGFLEMVELEFNHKVIYQIVEGEWWGALLYAENFWKELMEIWESLMNSDSIYNEIEAWITFGRMEANKGGETLLSLARE